MSDFIPRTEEVRRRFWIGTSYRSSDQVRENAAFDRWLEQHDAEVTAESEARIIKLLEQHPICVDIEGSIWCDDADCDTTIYWKTHFIDLIKGETE